MAERANPIEILRELEALHEELFRRLQDLEGRVAAVLAEYVPSRSENSQGLSGSPESTSRVSSIPATAD